MTRRVQQPVSVVMPVRNGLPFLDASISSILAQTHSEFELVIGDDGSTDGSSERLRQWARRDSRIRLFHGQGSGGPAESSNWVVRLASHPIVARMDADDVSKPNRIAAQLAVLEREPSTVLVGSLADFIDKSGRKVRPARRSQLRDLASLRSPFPHGSILFRRAAFEQAGGYRAACDFWEDQELYWRMAEIGRLIVLPEVHYSYRYNHGHARLRVDSRRVETALDLCFRCLAARRDGEDYEPLLAQEAKQQGGKLLPEAIRAFAALQLLSGARPAALRKLVADASLSLNRASVLSLAWCAAGEFLPGVLRLALTAHAYGREALFFPLRRNGPMEWRPHRAAAASD